MVRLLLVLAVFAAIVYIYALVDCALADRRSIRALPKPVWLLALVIFPLIGDVLWFVLGRPRRRPQLEHARRYTAPDDDPAFLRGLGDARARNERILRIEQELADLDDTGTDPDQPGRTDG